MFKNDNFYFMSQPCYRSKMREKKAKQQIHEFNIEEIDRDLPEIDLMIDYLENNVPEIDYE